MLISPAVLAIEEIGDEEDTSIAIIPAIEALRSNHKKMTEITGGGESLMKSRNPELLALKAGLLSLRGG
jgi:hypothetical protein